MKKIKNIIFEDFRAFYNEVNFDFLNHQGEPADFICIFGQNGMGKSSFFDGVEWLYTGAIDRMDNEIKNRVKEYKGCILRNTYSKKKELSVTAVYDDYSTLKRTFKQGRHKNDYKPGNLEPKDVDLVLTNQILPHNKIDNFVYAKSPQEKFQEWGKFWDVEGKEINYFTQLYSLNKLCNKEISELEKQLSNKENEIKKINIDKQNIGQLNVTIENYNKNKVLKMPEIKKIYLESNCWKFPDFKLLYDSKERLLAQNRIVEKEINKVQYLIENYKKVKGNKKKEQSLNNLNYRWKKIKKLCLDKLEHIDKKRNNENDLLLIKKQLEEIGIIYNATEQWFTSYLDYRKNKKMIPLLNGELDLSQTGYLKLVESKEQLVKIIEYQKKQYENIKDDKIEFLIVTKNYKEITKDIIEMESYVNDFKKNLKEAEIEQKRYQDTLKTINMITNIENDMSLINQLTDFTPLEDEDLLLKTEYIKKINDICMEIENQKTNISIHEKIYNESKNNYERLENTIIEVKDYVEKEKLKECPICKAPYESFNKLIERIDTKHEAKELTEAYNKYTDQIKQLKEMNNKKNIYIKEWNIIQKRIGVDINTKIKIITKTIHDIKNEVEKTDAIIKGKREELNIILQKFSDKHYPKKDINIYEVEKWLDGIVLENKRKQTEYENQFKELEEKYVQEKNNLKKEEEKINKLKNSINDFTSNKSNQRISNVLERFDNLSSWEDIQAIYNNLINKKDRTNKIIKDLEVHITKLNFVDITKKDYYFDKVARSEKDLDSMYRNQDTRRYMQYLKEVFKSNEISFNILKREKERLIKSNDILINKVESIERIVNDPRIEKYINTYKGIDDERKKLDKEWEKYKKAGKKLEDIFNAVEQGIEENIRGLLTNQTVSQIYKKIEPHKDFDELAYEIRFSNDGKPELYIKGINPEDNTEILPELFYSSAQLNTIALSMFLGEVLSMDVKINTVFIDDPVGHFDDINVLAFVDLLRAIVSMGQWQIIMSTHDESLYNLLQNKLSPDYYNSKFLKFAGVGVLDENS